MPAVEKGFLATATQGGISESSAKSIFKLLKLGVVVVLVYLVN